MRVVGFAGWSGAGKTTLLRKVIPSLIAAGYSVSTVKHAHHEFDVDQPGKDSWEHRQAGASEVLVGSAARWALMHELRGSPEPELHALLSRLSPVDVVLVEGFKRGTYPKIEVHRKANSKRFLHLDDASIIALVSDDVTPAQIPQVGLDDVEGVVALVLEHAAPFSVSHQD